MTTLNMTVAARTDVGRARQNNEDAYTVTDLASGEQLGGDGGAATIDVSEKGALLAVSDGMGGHQAGEVASALVLEALRTAMRKDVAGPMHEKIEAAVRRANLDVHESAKAMNKKGMGATLTAAIVAGNEAWFAEVGDSRAYLLRGDRLRQVTRDQSLVQMLVDTGLLSREEAPNSPHKNVILQGMGLADDVRVAIGRLLLRKGDTVLICCDGLSNEITDDELRDVLKANAPAAACARLIDLANERGGRDNLTAIVACFDGPALEGPFATETVTATFQVLQEFNEVPKQVEPLPLAATEPARPRRVGGEKQPEGDAPATAEKSGGEGAPGEEKPAAAKKSDGEAGDDVASTAPARPRAKRSGSSASTRPPADTESANATPAAPSARTSTRAPARGEAGGGRWMTWLLVLAIAGLAAWYFRGHWTGYLHR